MIEFFFFILMVALTVMLAILALQITTIRVHVRMLQDTAAEREQEQAVRRLREKAKHVAILLKLTLQARERIMQSIREV